MSNPNSVNIARSNSLNTNNRPIGGLRSGNLFATPASSFVNPNFAVANRTTFSPNTTNGRLNLQAPYSNQGFNGNPRTAPTWGTGPFRNTIELNVANNTLSNGYNLARGGVNYDYRGFRANDAVDPRLALNNPNRYSNGYPYNYMNIANYRGVAPYASLDPYIQRYGNGYPVVGQFANGYAYNYPYQQAGMYPTVPPECNAYLPCANTSNPAACIASSYPPGPPHCAKYLQ